MVFYLYLSRLLGWVQCFGFLFTFFTFQAVASDFQSPRTAALGGAGHASPLLNDSLYLNPSYTSYIPARSISFNYLAYSGNPIETPQGFTDYYGRNWNLSIMDGTQDSLFQAGIGYTRRNDAGFLHIGASKSILKQLGIGLGGKFIFPNDSSGQVLKDATFSMTGILTKWFQTALIVDNLFEAATSYHFYREFTLGTKFNIMSIFMVYFDPNWVPSLPEGQDHWGFETGAEFPFFTDFFLRLGTFKNSFIPYQAQRGDGYGFGLGWLGPRLNIDYAYSRSLNPISSYSHNFGVSLYF